jgi:hypothetical protein
MSSALEFTTKGDIASEEPNDMISLSKNGLDIQEWTGNYPVEGDDFIIRWVRAKILRQIRDAHMGIFHVIATSNIRPLPLTDERELFGLVCLSSTDTVFSQTLSICTLSKDD